MGVSSLNANQVCFVSVKHATCTDFVAKSRITTPRELHSLFSGNEPQRHRTRTTLSVTHIEHCTGTVGREGLVP